jgi:hypothetical protein
MQALLYNYLYLLTWVSFSLHGLSLYFYVQRNMVKNIDLCFHVRAAIAQLRNNQTGVKLIYINNMDHFSL